jgi:anion-transporting  ArsA/GET3 family ATPase
MAIEELCRIDESGEYDLVILDTPPTGHALDFLEAPRKLEDFLDRSMIGWFVKPYASFGWSAWKTASRSANFLFERIERATGVETLRQISEFFIGMEAMFDGITERSRRVREVLTSAHTAFVLVTGPDEQVLDQSEMLTEKVASLGMSLRGVVVNRLHPLPPGAEEAVVRPALQQRLAALLAKGPTVDGETVEWLAANHVAAQELAIAETERRQVFEAGLPDGIEVRPVPEFDADVHDLPTLARFADIVCGDD